MEDHIIEKQYPLTFRKDTAGELGHHLKNRHNVVLVGMKRVGISNFLRFFLYRKDVVHTYISKTEEHIFIPVDLNDLVEREIYPFWILTFKRIVDTAAISITLDQATKKAVETIFLDSIQSKDLFLLLDGIRKALLKIIEKNLIPTIFFVRFDRITTAATPEFFANLQGLQEATHQKLAYVFTSFRTLNDLAPGIFPKSSLSVFAQNMYIKPAAADDADVIFKTYRSLYKIAFTPSLEKSLFEIAGGYIQYLQLSLIFLHENKKTFNAKDSLFKELVADERIHLQSEELWESLNNDEKDVVLKISKGAKVSAGEREKGKYLWDSGFITKTEAIFSRLFAYYLKEKEGAEKQTNGVEFSKKEHLLFSYLFSYKDQICERELIISAVWPEVEALGVSDWAIDRLVARVRNKLKLQKNKYSIQTIKTRGYRLLTS